jgi:CubicO group peptidase (beta-lactamase class C family)
VALVVGDGNILLKKAYGLANREWNVPNTVTTRFNIASLAKSFTAILIMQLQQEGKLKLDNNLATYLPQYPAEAGQKVTLRQLLIHTSGIVNYEKLTPDPLDAYRTPLLLDEFIARYCSKPLESQPGTKFNYNNADYILLTKVIEQVCGKSWEQVVAEKILEPLKMRDTGCLKSQAVLARLASGYTVDSTGAAQRDPFYYVENYFGAGAMYSTVEDLLQLDKALRSNQLLSEQTKELMYVSNPQLGYVAIGSWVSSQPVGNKMRRVSERYGNTWGFHSTFVRFLDDRNTIILLTNNHRPGKNYEYEMKNELVRVLYEDLT